MQSKPYGIIAEFRTAADVIAARVRGEFGDLLIEPKLTAAGWDENPHSITEQYAFTAGRIIQRVNAFARRREL